MDAAIELANLRKRVLKANQDIEKRLKSSNLTLQYDAEMDYFYVRFDRVHDGSVTFNVESASPTDTLSLIVEEKALAVVGMDIMRFREAYLASNSEAYDLFDPLLANLDYDDFRLEVGPKGKWALYVPRQVEEALLDAA